MNFKKRYKRERAEPSINLTPLIDVVFILLIFFAVTTSFMKINNLDIDLPNATNVSDPIRQESINISITDENIVYYNTNRINIDQLEQILINDYNENPDRGIVIEADTSSLHGAVVRVIDAGKGAGFSKFAIATDKSQSSSY